MRTASVSDAGHPRATGGVERRVCEPPTRLAALDSADSVAATDPSKRARIPDGRESTDAEAA